MQDAAVREAAPDERAGLERVFVEHQARVFRAAYRITGNAQDAEDILQTVFLRLARQAEGTLDVANAASYLYRAAINSGFDLLRARRGRLSVPLDEAAEAPGALPGPDVAHEAGEIRDWLRRALATLPPRAAAAWPGPGAASRGSPPPRGPRPARAGRPARPRPRREERSPGRGGYAARRRRC